ncbi:MULTISPECIES: Hpt domain-containing protein [Zobellia]|uniref:Hpt domain-containing protein n=1 Tax=Zobellia TaxID=112040 RepID=UPI001BFF9485|nr:MULTISPECIES: Hpt domain-containing protein [Zobellia]MBT9190246.1 Hpt domain-containing protein [Zobellia russellii]MBU2973980.1 Hpt domain-containing protein [Zobellia sp. B3R18]MDO6821020.1 Hpt domain-containing protein [Zobellia sp. 1_MG-2023]
MEQPNLKYIKELSGDDIEFEEKFISILKDEFPSEKASYQEHIVNKELALAADVVHKLKHKFNILSMEDAYRFAVTFEEQLRAGTADMDSDFLVILNKIEDFLKTI